MPRNTDSNIHCQNPIYQTKCVLCKQIDTSMVKHYTKNHPQSEVFISRLSPAMVERIKSRNNSSMLYKNGEITGFCYFCEKPLSMDKTEWKQHLLSHTGECDFSCTVCGLQMPNKMPHGNCSTDNIVSSFDNDSIDGVLKMFICKWCAYIQISRTHMIRHLGDHSHIDSNFQKNIINVTFIPNLQPIAWEISSNYQFVSDSAWYRCNIRNCGKCFNNPKEFENHFENWHPAEVSFSCPHCHTVVEKKAHHFNIDISKHLKYHGRYLLECFIGKEQLDREFTVINHIIRNHQTECIKYRTI